MQRSQGPAPPPFPGSLDFHCSFTWEQAGGGASAVDLLLKHLNNLTVSFPYSSPPE